MNITPTSVIDYSSDNEQRVGEQQKATEPKKAKTILKTTPTKKVDIVPNPFGSQEDSVLYNMMCFYKLENEDGTYNENNNLEKMLRVINGEQRISLRIIDWFVTNYAKKYDPVYMIPAKREGQLPTRFRVYSEYNLYLDGYKKKKFDPFCRWDRLHIPYKDNVVFETTLCQLSFFKWAIQNNVIDYISEHYEEIEADMNKYNTTARQMKKNNQLSASSASASDSASASASLSSDSASAFAFEQQQQPMERTDLTKTRRKRKELSTTLHKHIYKERVNITFSFNSSTPLQHQVVQNDD